MADIEDLKSSERNLVWVRVPLSAPKEHNMDRIQAINCFTKEEALQLLAELAKQNYTWCSGKSLTKVDFWDEYEQQTCYFVDTKQKEVTFGTTTYAKRKNYNIIPYSTLKHLPKEKTTNQPNNDTQIKVTIVVEFNEEQLKNLCVNSENELLQTEEQINETINNCSIAELLEKGTYSFQESKIEYEKVDNQDPKISHIIETLLSTIKKPVYYGGPTIYAEQNDTCRGSL